MPNNRHTVTNMPRRNRVIVAQPSNMEVWDFENNWQAGLSECCDDMKECCFAYFCSICYVTKHIFVTNNLFIDFLYI